MSRSAEDAALEWFMDWITRMGRKWGGTVYGKRYEADGNTPGPGHAVPYYGYDWGQALCAERYGFDSKQWPDDVSQGDIDRAKRWEAGEWPAWAEKPEVQG